jgi:hypothetical protein
MVHQPSVGHSFPVSIPDEVETIDETTIDERSISSGKETQSPTMMKKAGASTEMKETVARKVANVAKRTKGNQRLKSHIGFCIQESHASHGFHLGDDEQCS